MSDYNKAIKYVQDSLPNSTGHTISIDQKLFEGRIYRVEYKLNKKSDNTYAYIEREELKPIIDEDALISFANETYLYFRDSYWKRLLRFIMDKIFSFEGFGIILAFFIILYIFIALVTEMEIKPEVWGGFAAVTAFFFGRVIR